MQLPQCGQVGKAELIMSRAPDARCRRVNDGLVDDSVAAIGERAKLVRMFFRRKEPIEQADRAFRERFSKAQKVALHDVFESILDQLQGHQRGPDAWEEACLVHALSFMEAGLYDRAKAEVHASATPAGQRSTWREAQVIRNPQRYSLAQLRLRFDAVKADLV